MLKAIEEIRRQLEWQSLSGQRSNTIRLTRQQAEELVEFFERLADEQAKARKA